MPTIYKNNVKYAGSVNDAASVKYGNTESGLEATNVQSAVDEVSAEITSLNSSLANKMEVKDLKSLYENTNTLFASDYSLATTDLNTLPLGTYKAEGNITQATHDALHYPSDLFGNFAQLTIVNIGQTNGNDGYRKQILIASNNKIYYRVQSWNTWGAWQRLATTSDFGDYYYSPIIVSQNVASGNTVSFTTQPQKLLLVTISHTWFGVISYYVSTNQQNGADIQNITKAGNGYTMSTVTASYENNVCTINVKNDSSNTMYVKVRSIM